MNYLGIRFPSKADCRQISCHIFQWFCKSGLLRILFFVYRQFVFLRTQLVAELVAEIKAFLLFESALFADKPVATMKALVVVESALFAKNNFLIVLDFLFQELAYSELV